MLRSQSAAGGLVIYYHRLRPLGPGQHCHKQPVDCHGADNTDNSNHLIYLLSPESITFGSWVGKLLNIRNYQCNLSNLLQPSYLIYPYIIFIRYYVGPNPSLEDKVRCYICDQPVELLVSRKVIANSE